MADFKALGKTTEVDGEGKMDNNSASTSETIVSRSKSVKEKKSDLEEIKEQLKQIMALVPIVKELKVSYDSTSINEEEGNEGDLRKRSKEKSQRKERFVVVLNILEISLSQVLVRKVLLSMKILPVVVLIFYVMVSRRNKRMHYIRNTTPHLIVSV